MQLKKRVTFATSDELSDLRDHGLDRDHEITVSTVSDLRPHGPPADWGRMVPSRRRRRPITLLGAGHRRMTLGAFLLTTRDTPARKAGIV